jgi:hypothetical protein
MKMNQDHVVPPSDPVLAILDKMRDASQGPALELLRTDVASRCIVREQDLVGAFGRRCSAILKCSDLRRLRNTMTLSETTATNGLLTDLAPTSAVPSDDPCAMN